jgi:outer membrane immunogenic protein
MKRLLATSALILAAAGPALADPGSVDWTGFYVGADLATGSFDISSPTGSGSGDISALGLLAGYNYDMGDWLIGGELGYDMGDLSANGLLTSNDADTTRLLGRAGYQFNQALIYGTLGWSNIAISSGGGGGDADGMNYGIGVDYMLTDRFILGAAYMVDYYDNIEGSAADIDTGTFRIRGAFRF